jgi:hypothetical protein
MNWREFGRAVGSWRNSKQGAFSATMPMVVWLRTTAPAGALQARLAV